MTDERPFRRLREVSALLGVVPFRVYQLVASGVVPSVRVGGAIRIPRAAWEQWLKSQADAALVGSRTAVCATREAGAR